MYILKFIQHLMPDGRERTISWECQGEEQSMMAEALVKAGYRFENELLSDYKTVSLTCELDEDGETDTIAQELTTNDPAIIPAVANLIKVAYEHLKSK